MELIAKHKLKNVKDLFFSKNYIVACTGRKAIIMDKKLNVINEIGNLYYVYKADISCDEKWLLLISTSNIFYLVSLEDMSITKYTVKAPYSENLEGKGCFSFDGKYIYIIATKDTKRDTQRFVSVIRRYSVDDMSSYIEVDYNIQENNEEYLLHSITPVKELNKYLIRGVKVYSDSVMFFDGEKLESHIIKDWPTDDHLWKTEYSPAINKLIVYGSSVPRIYELDGTPAENASDIEALFALTDEFVSYKKENQTKNCRKTLNINNIDCSPIIERLKNDGLPAQDVPEIENLFKMLNNSLSASNSVAPDSYKREGRIEKAVFSSNGMYLYLGTNAGFRIVDRKTKKTVAKEYIKLGVTNITEISDSVVAVSVSEATKMYTILDR